VISKLDGIARELAKELGAESLNISAVLLNHERLGCNVVVWPMDTNPGNRALAFRTLATHLRYCADRAEAAAVACEQSNQGSS
jgi:hypothetical protein